MTSQNVELGREYPPPNEANAIARIAEISVRQIERIESRPAPRDQHFKQHGCVWAEFIVEDNLSQNLRVGIFKQPKTFPAWIRFSNSRAQDDSKSGIHGMAIKLMEVEGDKVLEEEKDAKTQDFILIDYPVFFIRTMQDYVQFTEEVEKQQSQLGRSPDASASAKAALKGALKFLFPGFNPFKWYFREFVVLILAMQVVKRLIKINSPLETQYWSTTPYRHGSQAIKFFVKPSPNNKSGRSPGNTENYLREAMVDHLKSKDASFDFYLQLQTDPVRMPIEDSTVEWRGAQEYKVATIKIPRQVFDSPEQMEFGEHLSYTPWHCLPEHLPLGGINRSRKEIYQRTSKRRHELNQALRQEPIPETFTPQLLGQ